MATNVRSSLTDNSTKDNTGDAINGSEVDSNPNTLADILDGTSSVVMGGAGQTKWGYGAIFNEDSNDSDFRIETNNVANGFVVNAGLDTFGFGADGQDDQFVTISPPAASHTATTNTYNLHVTSGGAQTIPSGTTAYVGTVNIEEPNITATGTVTNAFSLRVAGAPTEGGNNYALWVDAGTTRLDGLVDIDGSIDADVSAVDVDSSGDIVLTSTSDEASAIYLRANAGTTETIKIHADQGTSESSIQLLSDAGGIDIDAASDKDVDIAGGQINLSSSHNTASAIYLRANAGTTETIKIHADQGSAENSIQLLSDAGGIDIDAAAGKDVDIAGGQINLTSSHNTASAIYLRSNAGTSETIKIHADQGSGTGSITVVSDAGGIDIDAAGAIAIDSSGAGISLDAGGASNFTTSGGALTLTSAADATWSVASGILTINGAGGIGLQEGGADVIKIGDDRTVTLPLATKDEPVVLGHTVPDATVYGETPMLQVIGDGSPGTAGQGSIALIRYDDGTDGPWLNFCKSKNDTKGSHTTVADNDKLGTISFQADDGTNFATQCAYIRGLVDDDGISTAQVGGELVFATTSINQAASTIRMSIGQSGVVNIAGLGTNSTVSTDGSSNLTTSSDANLKNNLGEITDAVEKILKIPARYFTWKEDSVGDPLVAQPRLAGFFSQEVYAAFPEGSPGGANLHIDGNEKWGLNSHAILSLVLAGVKEINARLKILEAG